MEPHSSFIQSTLLDNGITVVTEHMPGLNSASIGVWLDKGSRDENLKSNGISHFFEHMVFKGTQKRSSLEIVQTLECTGGQINAFTSKEQTCFYARVVESEVDLALDVLLDMITGPTLESVDIQKEREVVIEEIKGGNDNPEERVYDLFSEALFGNQGPGLPITGTVESVEGLDRKELVTHLEDIQRDKPLIVSAAGKIDHEHLCSKVRELTGNIPSENGRKRASRKFDNIIYNQRHLSENMDVQQIIYHLGCKGYNFSDKRSYALAVLNTLLGDGMSSVLFQDLREKFGYVYQINTFTEFMADCGVFGVSFNTEPKYLQKVIQELAKILKNLKEQGITQDQLKFAKAYIKGNFYLEQESTQSRMAYLARMTMQKEESLSREEYLAEFDKVTLEDVNDVCRDLFHADAWTSAAILPEGFSYDITQDLQF